MFAFSWEMAYQFKILNKDFPEGRSFWECTRPVSHLNRGYLSSSKSKENEVQLAFSRHFQNAVSPLDWDVEGSSQEEGSGQKGTDMAATEDTIQAKTPCFLGLISEILWFCRLAESLSHLVRIYAIWQTDFAELQGKKKALLSKTDFIKKSLVPLV